MVWVTMQEHVYQTGIHNVDELKQQLIHCNLDQNIISKLLTNGVKTVSMSLCKGRSFRAHHVNSSHSQ